MSVFRALEAPEGTARLFEPMITGGRLCPARRVLAGLLGVCTTVLKKICRENGIQRWPQRKLQSINKMMNSIELSMRTCGARARPPDRHSHHTTPHEPMPPASNGSANADEMQHASISVQRQQQRTAYCGVACCGASRSAAACAGAADTTTQLEVSSMHAAWCDGVRVSLITAYFDA